MECDDPMELRYSILASLIAGLTVPGHAQTPTPLPTPACADGIMVILQPAFGGADGFVVGFRPSAYPPLSCSSATDDATVAGATRDKSGALYITGRSIQRYETDQPEDLKNAYVTDGWWSPFVVDVSDTDGRNLVGAWPTPVGDSISCSNWDNDAPAGAFSVPVGMFTVLNYRYYLKLNDPVDPRIIKDKPTGPPWQSWLGQSIDGGKPTGDNEVFIGTLESGEPPRLYLCAVPYTPTPEPTATPTPHTGHVPVQTIRGVITSLTIEDSYGQEQVIEVLPP